MDTVKRQCRRCGVEFEVFSDRRTLLCDQCRTRKILLTVIAIIWALIIVIGIATAVLLIIPTLHLKIM